MIQPAKNNTFSFSFFAVLFILTAAASLLIDQYYLIAIPFLLLFFYAGWQNISFVFLLLIFSLPFSMEYQVTGSLGTDLPDEPLMLLTAGLFFCYCMYKPSALQRPIVAHPLIILLLVGFAWSVCCSFSSTQPLLSFKYLLAKTWYIGAFILAPLIVFREKKFIRYAIIALAVAMILVTVLTLLRHFQYGFTFASINTALHPFFRNHVNYSAMLVCVIPIVAIYRRSVSGKLKVIAGLILLVLLAALFLSYARGAWLALLTGIVTSWLIRKKWLVGSYAIVIALVITAICWIKSNDRYLQFAHDYRTTIFHVDFRDHLEATYEFKDVSTAERFYRWIAGVRMIKDKPFTGYGPNTFYNNYRPYAIPAFKTWVSTNYEHSTVHNYFLLIIIEQGIPGLLFFLLLTGAMLYYAQHLYHRMDDRFYKSVAMGTGVIIVMILTVNFLSDLIETDKIGSLFFLMISMLVVTDVNTRKKPEAGSV